MTRLKNPYTRALKPPTQREPAPGTIPNDAGGYVYPTTPWQQLERFIILGTEGGDYYAGERARTYENVQVVDACIAEDPRRVAEKLRDISQAGRALKADPGLFVLARLLAASEQPLSAGNEHLRSDGKVAARYCARLIFNDVVRTGTHLFTVMEYLKGQRGWGRGLRRTVQEWFADQSVEELALDAIKYRQRAGWTWRDVLLKAHVKPPHALVARPPGSFPPNPWRRTALYHYMAKGWGTVGLEPHPDPVLAQVWAAERLRWAPEGERDAEEVARLIREYRLPREAVPTPLLSDRRTWEALLPDMPMMATIRNLATMTRNGTLLPGNRSMDIVLDRLANTDQIKRARIHPWALYLAAATYTQGHNERGDSAPYTALMPLVQALGAAFENLVSVQEPSRKYILVGLDTSGSMTMAALSGCPYIKAAEAAMMQALMFVKVEPHVSVMGFDTEPRVISMTPDLPLYVVKQAAAQFRGGRTDASLPFVIAERQLANGLRPYDAVVIISDNQTWAGKRHPYQALLDYRRKAGRNDIAMVAVNMTPVGYSLVPDTVSRDGRVLNITGWDGDAATVLTDFLKGL